MHFGTPHGYYHLSQDLTREHIAKFLESVEEGVFVKIFEEVAEEERARLAAEAVRNSANEALRQKDEETLARVQRLIRESHGE